MLDLVRNSYSYDRLDREMRAQEFELLGRVCRDVAVRRLVPHTDPARIDALCERVLSDVAGLTETPAAKTGA